MASASRDRGSPGGTAPWLALAVAIWALAAWAAAPPASATDKMAAPGAVRGERTTIVVRPDAEAAKLGLQQLEILENGSASCRRLRLRGAIAAPVVGHVTFPDVAIGSCLYLGMPARLNTSSCEVVITSGGLGKFASRGGRCHVRLEAPGCTVHLGKGPFLQLGYHNEGAPSEITALTEPIAIGATAVGAICPVPGPAKYVQYRGYLRLGATRDGERKPFRVTL